MSILIVNTKSGGGGAAIAANRLCAGLREKHMEASMLVRRKTGDEPYVRTPNWIQKWYARFRGKLDGTITTEEPHNIMFSANRFPDGLYRDIKKADPDIVHLHWIAGGYVRPESLTKIPQPIVWTLHDMWPFTGGCHYSRECTRYEKKCGQCPILNSDKVRDEANRLHNRKIEAWKEVDFTIISPSEWLADCAQRSRLFHETDIRVIHNGIDVREYKPRCKNEARDRLDLPESKKLVTFPGSLSGASRKGQQFVRNVFADGWDDDSLHLVTFGETEDAPINMGVRCHRLGYLSEDELKTAYSATDAMLIPSLADNQPNTIMEAMASGTPCVAFDSGGIPEMIDHRENGYLANRADEEDLRAGINWTLSDEERLHELSQAARETIKRQFSRSESIKSHIQLYRELN